MARIQGLTVNNQISLVQNAPYPIAQGPGLANESYGYLPPFCPRIQPLHQGWTGGFPYGSRAILWMGTPNRAWGLRPTNNLVVRASDRASVRGMTNSYNLNGPSLAWPKSNSFSGAAPASGIYTGVDDEDC